MPLRSVKMKRRILGFQRRVWCPKWTPEASSGRIVTTAMRWNYLSRRPGARDQAWRLSRRSRSGRRPGALVTDPEPARRDRPEAALAAPDVRTLERTREVGPEFPV